MHCILCIVTCEGADLNCESFCFDEDIFEIFIRVACYESYVNCCPYNMQVLLLSL